MCDSRITLTLLNQQGSHEQFLLGRTRWQIDGVVGVTEDRNVSRKNLDFRVASQDPWLVANNAHLFMKKMMVYPRLLFFSSFCMLLFFLLQPTCGLVHPKPQLHHHRDHNRDHHHRDERSLTPTGTTINTTPRQHWQEDGTDGSHHIDETRIHTPHRAAMTTGSSSVFAGVGGVVLVVFVLAIMPIPLPAHAELTHSDIYTIKEMVKESEARIVDLTDFNLRCHNQNVLMFLTTYALVGASLFDAKMFDFLQSMEQMIAPEGKRYYKSDMLGTYVCSLSGLLALSLYWIFSQ